jgi:tRNA(fMet)-specific endonuclease VapC
MTYLLDTNICIYIIKQKPQIVFDKFKKIALGNIGISSISVAELFFGVMKSANIEKNSIALEQFLLPLEIIDFDSSAAIEYGEIRAILERKGTPIGSLDMLIAAHAKSQALIVVTNNEKEFNRVEGLKVENWAIE